MKKAFKIFWIFSLILIIPVLCQALGDNWYQDFDGDGYGNPNISISASSQPAGYVAGNTDCDDTDSTIHPGANEIGDDGIDQDCNGSDFTIFTTWYLDSDGDGYGDPGQGLSAFINPAGYVADNTDCDDNDATIHPGAIEIAGDTIDQDCNGSVEPSPSASNTITIKSDLSFTLPDVIYKSLAGDVNLSVSFKFFGNQGDTLLWERHDYGTAISTGNPITIAIDLSFSIANATYQSSTGDINLDTNFKFFGDQSGKLLWELKSYTVVVSDNWYQDFDMDGYGNPGQVMSASSQPAGYVADNTDCDDTDPSIHPGATEITGDTIDQDCNGSDLASSASTCGAYVASGVWKEFDCYNLAAIGKTTNDDPFTPSWRLIGGYWQWGRKGPDSSQWYDTNTANFAHGPTGPDPGDANDGTISSWDGNYAPFGSWSDTSKTANDPCPDGYRVPTQSQWIGVIDNNTPSFLGSWTTSATNYDSAIFFGDDLMLPAAGYRNNNDGLSDRGRLGLSWSSTSDPNTGADGLYLHFKDATTPSIGGVGRRFGMSVRCIAE
jgi:uncharacterized protein (TIGR02145 family)